MDEAAIARMLTRLSHELVEHNKGTENVCVLGIRRRGEYVARRIVALVKQFYGVDLPCAGIDIGMYRDDLVSSFFVPEATVNRLGFPVDGKRVVLCDDVLHTGRSVRAAIEAIFDLGRPACIELLVLCDRGGREIPISSCATAAAAKFRSAPTSSAKTSPRRAANGWICACRRSKEKTVSASVPSADKRPACT